MIAAAGTRRYAGALLAVALAAARRTLLAFVASSLAITGVIGTAGVVDVPLRDALFHDPNASLTVWDSVSSHLRSASCSGPRSIFMPLIILYTGWAYKVMSGKVTVAYIRATSTPPLPRDALIRTTTTCGISLGFWASALPFSSRS